MPFSSPNYTQAPNDLFDEYLKDMGEAELKVMLVLIRYTFGYHRTQIKMSIANIAKISGLSRNGVIAGAEAAEAKGLIERETIDKRPRPATIWKIKLPEEVIAHPVSYKNDLYLTERAMDSSPSELLLNKEINIFKENAESEPMNVNQESEEIAAQHRKSSEEALFKSIANQANGGLDLAKYPERVRPVFQEIYELWGISPPVFGGNSKKNSRAALWIEGGDELVEACGEFGVDALRAYRADFEAYMDSHRGVAPHTVSSPKSLVNVVRGKAGELRLKSREFSQDLDVPPEIRGTKGRYIHESGIYFDGKLVQEQEHPEMARRREEGRRYLEELDRQASQGLIDGKTS